MTMIGDVNDVGQDDDDNDDYNNVSIVQLCGTVCVRMVCIQFSTRCRPAV